MKHFKIKTPIWKTKSVGLNEDRIYNDDDIHVDILYKKVDGERLYPETFYIKGRDVLSCPVMNVKGNILRIVPISMMKGVNSHD